MDLHSYDKANDIRKMIKKINGKIESLDKVDQINLSTKKGGLINLNAFIGDIVEKRCNENLTGSVEDFLSDIRMFLNDYKERLEREFNNL